MALLEIKNLRLDFRSPDGDVRALDSVSLSLDSGETLCVVGESGCGKSVTALSITRLVPSPPAVYAGGEIRLEGRDVLQMNSHELCAIRGGVVSYVFQEPSVSLNPVFRVGSQIRESLKLHRPEKATRAEVIRLLRLVGIPAPELRARDYPFQLSGGMQQRVMIAMALSSEPKLLIADEPTTALDVTIQAQILELLRDLQKRLGMAILLITHNLGVVAEMADRVAVMYAGQVIEQAPAGRLLQNPLHPYTRALLASVPRLNQSNEALTGIGGAVPLLTNLPKGCRFEPRCDIARRECGLRVPELEPAGSNHAVRCPWHKSARGSERREARHP